MKKYILFTFIILGAIFFSGCLKNEPKLGDLETIVQRGYLIVGVKEDSPPFGYYGDDGQLRGIDIELAKNIANAIFESNSPNNIMFVSVNPQNRIAKLNSKEVDILVATMSINKKRKLVIDFSMPYYIANQKLTVRKNSKITHAHYFNSHGQLGVILGTTGERIVNLIAPTARITGARSYKEAVDLLEAGLIDGIIGDDCILKGYLSENLKMLNKSYSREYYGVALRKSDESTELLNTVNTVITSMLDEKKLGRNSKI